MARLTTIRSRGRRTAGCAVPPGFSGITALVLALSCPVKIRPQATAK